MTDDISEHTLFQILWLRLFRWGTAFSDYLPELDVATGAVCGMATCGPSYDSGFYSLIMPHEEEGLCSLV